MAAIFIRSLQNEQVIDKIAEQKGISMNKRTARKWEKVTREKTEKNQNTAAIIIKTHERSYSEAEILVPTKYKELAKPDNVLLIEGTNKEFAVYVQTTPNSLREDYSKESDSDKSEMSILKNIADLYGVIYSDNGMFKGQIRTIHEKIVLQNKELDYVEILIRNNYFSRRDQYKVSESLKDRVTHVYNKKVLYFENTEVEITNMLKNSKEILKTGFITKNTRLIFRSSCAKTAILVELSKESFDLNATRELYLERMIQFLIIYFHRNNFFNNQHRVEIILFARLFYPEFSTLTEVYQYLLKEAPLGRTEKKFEVNCAVSLQKDFKGRIYQDAYRKIVWESTSVNNFKKYFLEKVSEFLFTLNWNYNQNKHSDFISNSISEKVSNQFEFTGIPEIWKIKPFIHRMRCELSSSYESNCFEAICLVSEQYKHHYKFRSLNETGNAIIILSAGKSEYETDSTTYKMAKSYIYLTNISCMMVNLNKKVGKVKVHVYEIPRNLFKEENDIKKLQNLSHWCI